MTGGLSKLIIPIQLVDSGLEPEWHGNAFDIATPVEFKIYSGECKVIPLGIAFDLPEDVHIEIAGRSSTFARYNCFAPLSVLDSAYQHVIHGFLYNCGQEAQHFFAGQRLWQGVLRDTLLCDFKVVDHIGPTGRGGLGSTGR